MRHPPVDACVSGVCYGHMDVALRGDWQDYAVLPEGFQARHIYSSPLSRCLRLTEALAKRYGLSYQTDDRLMEFCFGEWEGKKWDDIPVKFIDEWAKNPWEWQIPGGETGSMLLRRVSEVWNEIRGKEQTALIVSHGGPLRLLRQIAVNRPVELLGTLPDFGQVEVFTFTKKNLSE